MTETVYSSETEKKNDFDLTPEELTQLGEFAPKPPAPPVFTNTPALQDYILGLMATEGDWLTKYSGRISPVFFAVEANQIICGALNEYNATFGGAPSRDILVDMVGKRIVDKQPQTKANIMATLHKVIDMYVPNLTDRAYIEAEVDRFIAGAKLQKFLKNATVAAKEGKTDLPALAAELAEIGTTGATEPRAYLIDELDLLPPVEWLIKDHYTSRGFACLFGPYGSGKSFAALDQALCIATGRDYLGKYPVKQGAVCYVAAEGHSGIRKRIKAWLKHTGLPTPQNFALLPEAFDLHGDASTPTRIAACARRSLGCDPVAVFIDTLARNFGGGDENQTQDMNMYIANVARLGKACAATTVSVHHSGKDFKKGPRGAVALGGACDSMIEVSGKPSEGMNVAIVKQKDAPELLPYTLKQKLVELAGEPDGSIVLEWEGSAPEQPDQQLADEDYRLQIHLPELAGQNVSAENGKTQAQLETLLQWSSPKVHRVLSRLLEKNKVQRCKPKGARWAGGYLYYREAILAGLNISAGVNFSGGVKS